MQLLTQYPALTESISLLRNAPIEHVLCVYISYSNPILEVKLLASSVLGFCSIKPEAVKESCPHDTSAIVLLHNHISGIVYPSRKDISITQQIRELCLQNKITLLDHLIVTHNQLYSIEQLRLQDISGY